MIPALLLLACKPDAPDSGAGTTTNAELPPLYDSSFYEEDRPTSQPQYTADEVVARVNAWLDDTGFAFPGDVFTEYYAALALGDEDCPGEGPDLVIPLSGCTSASGYTYTGLALLASDARSEDGGRVALHQGFAIADFSFVDLAGARFVGSGWCDTWWYSDDDGAFRQALTRLTGSWTYERSAEPWLRAGASVNLNTEMYTFENHLRLTGSLSVGEYSMYFDGVEFERDGVCQDQVVLGDLWVRQDDGSWNQIKFTDDCSVCPEVWWNNEIDLGPACADFSALPKALRKRLTEPPE